jgi:acetyl-CoA synthetase
MSDAITSSGVVVSLDDAEAALRSLPSVREAVAVGLKDNFLGHALQLYVVLADNVPPSNDLRAELLTVVTDRLGGFRPRGLRFAARLPHGPDGQPARAAIAAVACGEDADPSTVDDASALAEIAFAS